MTAQPPGFRPSALRVATHGQQVASLGGGGGYPSTEDQSAYSTAQMDCCQFFLLLPVFLVFLILYQ